MEESLDKKKLLGLRLKELRTKKKWTIAKLSEKIGLEPSSLGNIENGYNYPKLSTLDALANALQCNITDFFIFEHHHENKYLIEQIKIILETNPEKVRDIYKIIKAFVD